MGNNYDKIKLIILRAALVVIGAGMGFLALWQYFLFYPDIVRREYQIVITVVSTALVALIFGLSAKAVYRLVAAIGNAVGGLKDSMGVRGIVAVALGLAVAVGLVTGFDFLIKLVVDIWAVRLLADVLVYIFCAALCCMGFTKWLKATGEKNENAEKTEKAGVPPVGYLIAAECFADERVITAVHTLINVKVCEGAYKALCLYGGESGAASARLMDALIKNGYISVLYTNKPFDGNAEYAQVEKQLADAKRLKPVVLDAGEKELSLSVFSPPTQELKQAAAALLGGEEQKASTEQKSLNNNEPTELVNGQIIIDK